MGYPADIVNGQIPDARKLMEWFNFLAHGKGILCDTLENIQSKAADYEDFNAFCCYATDEGKFYIFSPLSKLLLEVETCNRKNAPGGYAGLDANGKIDISQIEQGAISHNLISSCSEENLHPINSVTGLVQALDSKAALGAQNSFALKQYMDSVKITGAGGIEFADGTKMTSAASEINLSSLLKPGLVIAGLTDFAEGFLLCNGGAVSRTIYNNLFAAIGTGFGAGDGGTTFNLPDYRGMFLRGLGGNSAADFITAQGDAIRNITGYFNTGSYNSGAAGPFKAASTGTTSPGDNSANNRRVNFDLEGVVPVAEENRPVNYAVNWFIKY